MTPASVRDALGLARAILRAEQDAPRPSSEKLAKLAQAERDLLKACELIVGSPPVAERMARRGLDTLVSCVGTYDTLLPIVEAARRAVTGMPVPGVRGQREER